MQPSKWCCQAAAPGGSCTNHGQIWMDAHFFLALTTLRSETPHVFCHGDHFPTRFPSRIIENVLPGAHSCIQMIRKKTCERSIWAPKSWMSTKTRHFPHPLLGLLAVVDMPIKLLGIFFQIQTHFNDIGDDAAPSWIWSPLRIDWSERPFCALCQREAPPSDGGSIFGLFQTFDVTAEQQVCPPAFALVPQFIKAPCLLVVRLGSWQRDRNCESDYESRNAFEKHRGRSREAASKLGLLVLMPGT